MLENMIQYLITRENEINNFYGRIVEIQIQTGQSGCPYCELDVTYNVSKDPSCGNCGGKYYIPVIETVTPKVRIYWRIDALENAEVGGMIQTGDCVLLATDENISYFRTSREQNRFIIVDGNVMSIKAITPNDLKTKYGIICQLQPAVS